MAVKGIFILHKLPSMTAQEFGEYWRDKHGPVAKNIPGLRRYVQNHIVPGSSQGTPPVDGVAELYFDSAEALQAGLSSPAGKETLDDLPKFLDMTRSGMFLVQEVNIV